MALIFYEDTQKLNIFEIYQLSSNQAFQLDSKIDDGLPTSGNVRDNLTSDGMSGTGVIDDPPCTTAGVSPIKYDLTPATADEFHCAGIDFLF